MLFESYGELSLYLPCVITGTIVALRPMNDRELLTRVNAVVDYNKNDWPTFIVVTLQITKLLT